jgi:hypothetical protein
MKFRPGMEEEYRKGYNNNLDGYGHAVYTFAERWAALMEAEIERTGEPVKAITKNADRLIDKADTEGITGFMYGAAVGILSDCWEWGEILRKWHNKEYGYEGKGVVNPAILTVGSK